MKKIYINGRFLTQKTTGVQRYAEEIVKALDSQISDKKNYKWILLVPKNIIRNLNLENIEVKKVGYLKGHLWEQIELPFYSKDGILLNFCGCAPILKKNQMTTIHDAAVCVMPESFSFLFRSWYKLMFYVVGKQAKKIFTVSEFSKKELNKYFNIPLEKIEITYNGINHMSYINPNDNIFYKYSIEKNNYILAVSSLNPSKNFKLILKTAKVLPEYNFIIAGGTNSTVFKEQGFEITSNVKFIGYVNDEELVALYKYASCFVYPSIYEGFGIPPLEAMYFNCPVIVSDIVVFHEIIGNHALYCDINDEDILAKQIKKINVLETENNKKYVLEKFNWQIAAKKILNNIL
ncbi:hypothetical protein B5F82_04660 [Megamonas hypermegale]|uniref:glycosyltransferase family 4 protein n=1 Tax=Megamonas hypermegale TaxID=158847 RepID=UPI000B388A1F|nr:glycosyltransferase family 1 protein [Megamonas hypermegale]OUO40462.1 hypothetical protein B5F82_04660 [Megamonas hypermegale]